MTNTPQDVLPDIETIKRRLNEPVTPRQRLALRLALVEGLSQKDIGTRMGISQPQVSEHLKAALTNLRLGVNGEQAQERVKQALLSLPLTVDEQAILNAAKPKGGGLGGIVDEASKDATPPPQNRFNWRPLAIGGGALAIGVLLGFLLRPPPAAQVGIATPTLGPTQTARVEIAVTERVVELTVEVPQAVAVRETVLVPQTVTVPQTVIVSETVVVTATPSPTDAALIQSPPESGVTATSTVTSGESAATAGPVATNVASVSLPFSDNFDSGLDGQWKVVSGDWNMRNKQITNLSGNGLIWLGKQNWADIEVNVETFGGYCNGGTSILIRMQDPSNYIAFQAIGCNSEGLYLIKDAKTIKELVHTGGQAGKIKIVAIGSVYTVYNSNGTSVGTASDKNYASGSVGITMNSPSLSIDNLKIDVPK